MPIYNCGETALKREILVGLSLLLAVVLTAAVGCTTAPTDNEAGEGTLSGKITIFHAGSLSVPFDKAVRAFQERHPDVEFAVESAGSRSTIRKVTELGKEADIIGSADYVAIEQLMFPDFADWHVIFASNQMVIAFTDSSQYGDEINGDNWYEVLTREGVEYGRAEPDADPCGYRTLLVWQLAEQHYGVSGLYDELLEGCPAGGKNVRPKETDLIALLQSGDLDYAFEYRSIAEQHGLRYVPLPPQIDLSDIRYGDLYATASVEVAGKEPGTTQTQIGQPILYAVTIPGNARRADLALEFLKFLLGPEGQRIMTESGQLAIVPAIASDLQKLPVGLREYVVESG